MRTLDRRLASVRGLISPAEARRLADLAERAPTYSVVEIGSHTGLSTLWLASYSSSRVFAVDPWLDPRPGSRDDPFALETGDAVLAEFLENVDRFGLGSRIVPLRTTSLELATTWLAPIGLLFVDAIHTEDAVRADLDAWLPFVVPGGYVALHDYDSNPDGEYHGVAIVADELATSPSWSLEPLVDSLWTARRIE